MRTSVVVIIVVVALLFVTASSLKLRPSALPSYGEQAAKHLQEVTNAFKTSTRARGPATTTPEEQCALVGVIQYEACLLYHTLLIQLQALNGATNMNCGLAAEEFPNIAAQTVLFPAGLPQSLFSTKRVPSNGNPNKPSQATNPSALSLVNSSWVQLKQAYCALKNSPSAGLPYPFVVNWKRQYPRPDAYTYPAFDCADISGEDRPTFWNSGAGFLTNQISLLYSSPCEYLIHYNNAPNIGGFGGSYTGATFQDAVFQGTVWTQQPNQLDWTTYTPGHDWTADFTDATYPRGTSYGCGGNGCTVMERAEWKDFATGQSLIPFGIILPNIVMADHYGAYSRLCDSTLNSVLNSAVLVGAAILQAAPGGSAAFCPLCASVAALPTLEICGYLVGTTLNQVYPEIVSGVAATCLTCPIA